MQGFQDPKVVYRLRVFLSFCQKHPNQIFCNFVNYVLINCIDVNLIQEGSTSTASNYSFAHTSSGGATQASAVQAGIVLTGRLLYSAIFLMTALSHFSSQAVAYAAAAGVPFPSIAVPAAGIVAIAGGLSILLGYRARVGAWLLVLFLVPVTLTMHNFWAVKDPMMAQMQMVMFMKNLSMLGGALLISQFGAGPFSLDAKRER